MSIEKNPNNQPATYQLGVHTEIGTKYDINQDSHQLDNDNGIFFIADGIGGRPAGEVASQIAVRVAHTYLEKAIISGQVNNHEKILSETIFLLCR